MKEGLIATLYLLAVCGWSVGYANCIDEEVEFAFGSCAAVASSDLDEERAREGADSLAFAHGALRATMAGNATNTSNMTTYNIIDSGAFADAGGIVSVIQNTGNNVIIQNLTDVNVTIMP